MPTETTTIASCTTCGHTLDATADGGPCPSCGGTGVVVSFELTEKITVTVDLVEEFGPGDSDRDAVRRWRDADHALRALEQPLEDGGRDGIHEAQHRLCAVFVELWSLRETLIERHGINGQAVDGVINQSPTVIALAHDLGNIVKHGSPLKTPPRTGHQPRFGAPKARCADGVCMFRLDVEYGGVTVDAMHVARQAIDEWGRHLTSWGVI